MVAERIIRRTLLDTDWVLGAQTSISSVLDKDRYLSSTEFTLFTQGSFDFSVYRENDQPREFAIEFDPEGGSF
jgi:hypothetical protein